MIHWLRRETVVVSQRPFSEKELLGALRCSDTDPLWRAVHQIIDEELRNVRQMALVSVKDHGILASWTGGAEALERLQMRLIQDRARAIGK